jgi:hypothetical protein
LCLVCTRSRDSDVYLQRGALRNDLRDSINDHKISALLSAGSTYADYLIMNQRLKNLNY